jgi:hypothetical protein
MTIHRLRMLFCFETRDDALGYFETLTLAPQNVSRTCFAESAFTRFFAGVAI